MKVRAFVGPVLALMAGWGSWALTQQVAQEEPTAKLLRIRQTEDFVTSGRGDASAWAKANWEPLHLRTADGHRYETRIKTLYSQTGLYVLLEAEGSSGVYATAFCGVYDPVRHTLAFVANSQDVELAYSSFRSLDELTHALVGAIGYDWEAVREIRVNPEAA